ncbi:hypothetical protein [Bradyrhizobium glycinis]|uniref:hypothetical protein n=1 Tax=Bradyrhizobium glycinis TaxID=2751812 RepID=UPI0018D6713C|nr:hypothetical protein [Bradyrhizobium glycinis]
MKPSPGQPLTLQMSFSGWNNSYLMSFRGHVTIKYSLRHHSVQQMIGATLSDTIPR